MEDNPLAGPPSDWRTNHEDRIRMLEQQVREAEPLVTLWKGSKIGVAIVIGAAAAGVSLGGIWHWLRDLLKP